MTSDSLYPNIAIANGGQEIVMQMQFKPGLPSSEITIKQFGPLDLKENTCFVTKGITTINVSQPSDVVQTLKQYESISLRCTRKLDSTRINGVDYACTKEVILNIVTSGPAKLLKIPKVCSTAIAESRADSLERGIQQVEKQINAFQSKLPSASDFFPVDIPSAAQDTGFDSCPSGSVLVSAACTNSDGGQAAVGPTFDSNGRAARCQRFGAGTSVEGALICMKIKE